MKARNPIGASFSLVFGLASLVLGIFLIGSAALGPWNYPIPWFIGAFGLMALMYSYNLLGSARLGFRPIDVSDDGEARLELTGPPARVGGSIQGTVLLGDEAEAGDPYRLLLSCANMDGGSVFATHHEDALDVDAVPAATGEMSLPFAFRIPSTAPPTASLPTFSLRGVFRWTLSYCPAEHATFGMYGGSSFTVQVGPAFRARS